jgi:hypothetical protein
MSGQLQVPAALHPVSFGYEAEWKRVGLEAMLKKGEYLSQLATITPFLSHKKQK